MLTRVARAALLLPLPLLLIARPSLGAGPDPNPPPPPAWAPTPERPAPAAGLLPVDTRSFFTTTTGGGSGGLGLGIGGRLGTTFSNGVSVAGSFTYQGWESGRLASLGSALYLGGEPGYDFNLRYVTVRPYFGVGIALNAQGKTADAELAIWGGAQATYDIPKTRLFLALDLRLVTTATELDLAVAAFAGFGVKFGS